MKKIKKSGDTLKINWPLIALGVLFFTVGVTGPVLYKQVTALQNQASELRKKGGSQSHLDIDSPAVSRTPLSTFDIAVPTSKIEVKETPHETEERIPTKISSTSSPTEGKITVLRGKFNGKATQKTLSSADLSVYRVRPRQTTRKEYLPPDESETVAKLKEKVNRREEEEGWEGEGFLGEVIKSAEKVVQTVDEATLDASQKALNSVASPNEAKIRPNSDGVRLHINIPADSIRLKK